MMTTRSRLLASSFLAGATLLAAAPALAQSTTPTTGNVKTQTTETQGQAQPSSRDVPNAGGFNAPGDTGAQVGEVVVTGSRIARRDYVADSPIVSVSPKAIENTGAPTLDSLFKEIPQFVGDNSRQNNNPGNGQVNINLRGLGSQRNLVLLDGRRITPSSTAGVVDINNIPQALIENVEIVTGGQSTSYGSDALAGVTNFKLKHNFQGVVIDASYGVSDQSDGQTQNVNVTMGSNFADDRGNAVISLGYSNGEPVFYGARQNVTRQDFSTISSAVLDPRILAVSGLSGTRPQGGISFIASNAPTQAAITNLFTSYGVSPAVAATIKPSYTLAPNNDGTLFNGAANYRGPTTIDFSTLTRLPTASNGGSYNTGALNYIELPLTRYNAFANAEYAITPHIKAYSQFFFTDYTASTRLAPSPASGNPTGVASSVGSGGTGFLVGANNPFIPTDLRTILNSRADPNAPFVFAKRFSELGARIQQSEFTTYQGLVGVKGDVPVNDITYDIYAAYGHYNNSTTQFGNVSHAAAAAVFANPTTAGGGACSNYNPFGISQISSACSAYISPETKNQTQFTQQIVEADFQGKLFTTPEWLNGHLGGDVRFAFGTDYRNDRASFLPDALLSSTDSSTNSYTLGGTTYNLVNNTAGVVGFNGAAPVSGDIDVYETYGELLVPIVKDLPFAKSINLDLGARYSDYSTIGSAYTYKADMEWKVTSWLLLRGGYSRAIRAPNVGELFTPATNGFFSIGGPSATGLGTGDPCDINGAARKGVGGVSAAQVRALCLAQGVPASVIDSFQGANTQVQELSGGNPNLQKERANTYTAGFVLTPRFSMPMFSHISASVDYYNIDIKGVIGTVSPSTQLSYCFNEQGTNPTYSNANSLCKLFIRDPTSGQIISGFSNNQNLGALRTTGVDFQVDWNFALSTLPYANLSDKWGSLAFNFTANWLNKYDEQVVPGGSFLDFRDSISSGFGGFFPVWRAFLNADYAIGPFDIGVQEQYLGNARDGGCVGLTSVCTNRGVDPEFYTNLNARWKINDMLELRGGVTNVFNKDPRFFTTASSSEGQTSASTYDLIGRSYFVALKARF